MSPDIYTTCLIIAAALLLYFGMYLLLGQIPQKLVGSAYASSRRFMGLAYLALALSIIVYFTGDMAKMSTCYKVALNISSYFIAAKLIAVSYITLIGKIPNFTYINHKRSFIFIFAFPIIVWIALLLPDKNIVHYIHMGCAIILLLSMIFDVKYFFKKYNHVVAQGEYFYTDGIGMHIKWMMNSLYSMIGVGLLSVAIALFSSSMPRWFTLVYLCYFIGLCIYIFNNFIHFMAIFGELVEMSDSNETLPEIDMSKTRISADTYQSLHKQISEWVEAKGYCQKKTSIATLSIIASSNRLYVSNYINTTYKCSFRAWVSKLRVEEAKRILMSDDNTTITSVAEQVGFLSLASFTHAFKQIEELSPSVWIKAQRKRRNGF